MYIGRRNCRFQQFPHSRIASRQRHASFAGDAPANATDTLPRRTVFTFVHPVGMPGTPARDHRCNVTKFPTTVFAFIRPRFPTVISLVLALVHPIGMPGTPTTEQSAQRPVFCSAMDAHVFTTLSSLVKGVFSFVHASWRSGTPPAHQRSRIPCLMPAILAVFTHLFLRLLCCCISKFSDRFFSQVPTRLQRACCKTPCH